MGYHKFNLSGQKSIEDTSKHETNQQPIKETNQQPIKQTNQQPIKQTNQQPIKETNQQVIKEKDEEKVIGKIEYKRMKSQSRQMNSEKVDAEYRTMRRSIVKTRNDKESKHENQLEGMIGQYGRFGHILNKENIERTELTNSQIMFISQIEMAKVQAISQIDDYFNDMLCQVVKDNLYYQKHYIVQNVKQKIRDMEFIAQNIQKVKVDEQKQYFDYQHFQLNLDQHKTRYNQILQSIRSKQKQQQSQLTLEVNQNTTQKLLMLMPEYVSVYKQKPNSQYELEVNRKNYFQEEPIMAYILDDRNQLVTYSLKNRQLRRIQLKNKENEIPYQHSLIVTPQNDIMTFGGIDLQNGNIVSKILIYDEEQKMMKPYTEMQVARVGSSICYMNNKVYVVGGKTNQDVCSKLCEVLDLHDSNAINRQESGINCGFKSNASIQSQIGQTRSIVALNYGRSKCGVCSFSDQYVFAFFGSDSIGIINQTIEFYDPKFNNWSLVNLDFRIKKLETSGISCTQINDREIVLFGGFHEQQKTKNGTTFSNKVGVFDFPTKSMRTTQLELPVDFNNSNTSEAKVFRNRVYELGHFMSKKGSDIFRCLDCEYLLQINNQSAEILKTINSE